MRRSKEKSSFSKALLILFIILIALAIVVTAAYLLWPAKKQKGSNEDGPCVISWETQSDKTLLFKVTGELSSADEWTTIRNDIEVCDVKLQNQQDGSIEVLAKALTEGNGIYIFEKDSKLYPGHTEAKIKIVLTVDSKLNIIVQGAWTEATDLENKSGKKNEFFKWMSSGNTFTLYSFGADDWYIIDVNGPFGFGGPTFITAEEAKEISNTESTETSGEEAVSTDPIARFMLVAGASGTERFTLGSESLGKKVTFTVVVDYSYDQGTVTFSVEEVTESDWAGSDNSTFIDLSSSESNKDDQYDEDSEES